MKSDNLKGNKKLINSLKFALILEAKFDYSP